VPSREAGGRAPRQGGHSSFLRGRDAGLEQKPHLGWATERKQKRASESGPRVVGRAATPQLQWLGRPGERRALLAAWKAPAVSSLGLLRSFSKHAASAGERPTRVSSDQRAAAHVSPRKGTRSEHLLIGASARPRPIEAGLRAKRALPCRATPAFLHATPPGSPPRSPPPGEGRTPGCRDELPGRRGPLGGGQPCLSPAEDAHKSLEISVIRDPRANLRLSPIPRVWIVPHPQRPVRRACVPSSRDRRRL